VAVGIVVVIAWTGFRIVAGAFSVLSDSQVVDAPRVKHLAESTPGVTHAHRVRSRGLPDDVHVDLHIHVPPDMTTQESHALAHEVVERIQREHPGVSDVIVHVEPEGHKDDH